MCRSRRELSNEYLLAKFGFDTAENEPCKVCPLSAYRSPRCRAGRVDAADGDAADAGYRLPLPRYVQFRILRSEKDDLALTFFCAHFSCAMRRRRSGEKMKRRGYGRVSVGVAPRSFSRPCRFEHLTTSDRSVRRQIVKLCTVPEDVATGERDANSALRKLIFCLSSAKPFPHFPKDGFFPLAFNFPEKTN